MWKRTPQQVRYSIRTTFMPAEESSFQNSVKRCEQNLSVILPHVRSPPRGDFDILNFGLLTLAGNEKLKQHVSIFSIFRFQKFAVLTGCCEKSPVDGNRTEAKMSECWSSFRCWGSERQVTECVSVQRAASDCEGYFYWLFLFLLISVRAAVVNI